MESLAVATESKLEFGSIKYNELRINELRESLAVLSTTNYADKRIEGFQNWAGWTGCAKIVINWARWTRLILLLFLSNT